MSMNVVFSSPYYQVFEYPELDAIELVDNVRATGALIQGTIAAGFRASLLDLSAQQSSSEDVDEMIGSYGSLMHLPLRLH